MSAGRYKNFSLVSWHVPWQNCSFDLSIHVQTACKKQCVESKNPIPMMLCEFLSRPFFCKAATVDNLLHLNLNKSLLYLIIDLPLLLMSYKLLLKKGLKLQNAIFTEIHILVLLPSIFWQWFKINHFIMCFTRLHFPKISALNFIYPTEELGWN